MNNLEKLINDLSNYWDLSPEKVVDRLNSMNESEIKKLINSMTKKYQYGGKPLYGTRTISEFVPKTPADSTNSEVMKLWEAGNTEKALELRDKNLQDALAREKEAKLKEAATK